ncbi:FkbM family methyltransferase [Reyranella sp.]|uniref:FkbM family methyltransferase n=1 Tax=Reyranella sp. TaxID=1929291 RepID=UPI003D0DDCBF
MTELHAAAMPAGKRPKARAGKATYSQFAEDIIAQHYLKGTERGTYVDVGCCYPILASNTYGFYQKGWRGICIDANPATRAAFEEHRPEDVFVHAGIAEQEGEKPYYRFSSPVYNTFDRSRADKVIAKNKPSARFLGEIKVGLSRLSTVLDRSGSPTKIDLMSIDVEGLELSVIRSNDFGKYRPRLLICELICKSVADALSSEVSQTMTALGYRLIAATGHDCFFLDERS